MADGCLAPPHRMSVPISISNPDLARHSTELFMDSGFSPLSQRMGAMVAFDRFEDFTRWGCRDMPGWSCTCLLDAGAVVESKRGWKSQSWRWLGSAWGSSCSSCSWRLGLSIFSTTFTWWGHDVSFGDLWSLGKACLAQVKHLCTLTAALRAVFHELWLCHGLVEPD